MSMHLSETLTTVSTRARLEEIVRMIRNYRAAKDVAKWIVEYAGQIKEILDGNHNSNLGQIDVLLERELALRHAEHTLAATAHILEPIRDAEFEMVEEPVAKLVDWDKVPGGYDWVAMEANGEWYCYDAKPSQVDHGWDIRNQQDGLLLKAGTVTHYAGHWTGSRCERP